MLKSEDLGTWVLIPFILRFLRPGSCARPLHTFKDFQAWSRWSNRCKTDRYTHLRWGLPGIGGVSAEVSGIGISNLTPATQFETRRLCHGADSCKQQRCDEELRGYLTAMSKCSLKYYCRLSQCLFPSYVKATNTCSTTVLVGLRHSALMSPVAEQLVAV